MKILPKDEPIRKIFTAENNFLTFLEFYQRIARLSGEYDSSDTKHLLNAFSLKFYHVIRQAKSRIKVHNKVVCGQASLRIQHTAYICWSYYSDLSGHDKVTFLLLSPTLKNRFHLTYYVKVDLRACLNLLSLCKTKYPLCRALLGVVLNSYTITRGGFDKAWLCGRSTQQAFIACLVARRKLSSFDDQPVIIKRLRRLISK